MYSKVQLLGVMGRTPQMSMVNDRPCATFSVATNRYLGNGLQPETSWWRVTIYGKAAETIGRMGQKGTKVYCEGRLIVDPITGSPKVYQRKDGTYGSSFDMVASTVKMISNYRTEQEAQQSYRNEQQNAQAQQQAPAGFEFDDTDIPF